MGSPRSAVAYFNMQKMLFKFFLLIQNQAKGWRRLSRWIKRLRAEFQPTSSGRRLEMGGSEGGVIPDPSHEAGLGPD